MTVDCRKMWFLDFSYVCRFCSQMRELLKFRCPDVVLWWFPAILRGFEKIKKWSFRWLRTRRKMIFSDFSHVCRFCSQMSVLLHFRCPDVKKKWCFRWLRTCRKISAFGHFTLLQILQPNEWIVTFQVSWCRIIKISCHFKGFWKFKKKKNWSFQWLWTCRKIWVLDISHFCRFCSHMSGLLHFRCPDVILWWFPAILRAFEKFKNIEVFDDGRPPEKCRFCTFHTLPDFAAKWVNCYILGVLMSYYDDILPF